MIKVENVSKKFLRHKALENCTVSFDKGKIIGIIGENGSGKTTLLKLIAGLLQPSTGKILVDEEIVTRRISENLVFLHDRDYFYWYLTINELILYYDAIYSDFNKGKAYRILEFMKLDTKQPIKYLSKGNLTRLKITVTLAREASYIILDEPFSGLDPMVRKAIIQGILQFVNLEKQMIIMSTHEVAEVEAILDEAVLLKAGKVIAQRSIEDIREQEGMDVVTWMESVYRASSL